MKVNGTPVSRELGGCPRDARPVVAVSEVSRIASPLASATRWPSLTWTSSPTRGTSTLTVGATPGVGTSKGTGQVGRDGPARGRRPGLGLTWPVKSAITVPA